MKFNEIITTSKAIQRFAVLQNLSEDRLYELFFECYCSYIEIFRERMKYARNLKRVISIYKPIKAFGKSTPEQIIKAMFTSVHMHEWFAYRFMETIDKQLIEGNVDKGELQITLTFMGAIPTKNSMEEILNGKKVQQQVIVGKRTGRTRSVVRGKEGRTGSKAGVRL